MIIVNSIIFLFFLSDKFGHEEIGAENGKKENRSATGEMFTFREFLNVCTYM